MNKAIRKPIDVTRHFKETNKQILCHEESENFEGKLFK